MSYLYYIFYKFSMFTASESEQPEHIANILLTLLLLFNIFAFVKILNHYDIEIIKNFYKQKWLIIFIYSFFLGCGYLVFIRHRRYIHIIEKYDDQNRKKKVINTILSALYVISVIVLLIVF